MCSLPLPFFFVCSGRENGGRLQGRPSPRPHVGRTRTPTPLLLDLTGWSSRCPSSKWNLPTTLWISTAMQEATFLLKMKSYCHLFDFCSILTALFFFLITIRSSSTPCISTAHAFMWSRQTVHTQSAGDPLRPSHSQTRCSQQLLLTKIQRYKFEN